MKRRRMRKSRINNNAMNKINGKKNDKAVNYRYALIALLPIAILLNSMASRHSAFVERFYSMGFYKLFSQIVSAITGIVPFSIAEKLLIIGGGILIVMGGLWLYRLIKVPNGRAKFLKETMLGILSIIAVAYFIFIVGWGLNYNRLPLATIIGVETESYTVDELAALCERLVLDANCLREQVDESEEGIMNLSSGKKDVFDRAHLGYEALSGDYPALGGLYGRPKPVKRSEAMAYTGIWGMYFPYTVEANVNTAIPEASLPSTTAHEMAHQRGFAREDEANFIAYMVCRAHPDDTFKYSGTMLALSHAMNALARADRERYFELVDLYSEGVANDMSEKNAFIHQHSGRVSEVSNKTNNTYLKLNGQQDGVRSYGRMVDLLLATEHLSI